MKNNKESSYILKGWPTIFLPEEYQGEIEAVRQRLLKSQESKYLINLITWKCILECFFGQWQIHVENWFEQSTDRVNQFLQRKNSDLNVFIEKSTPWNHNKNKQFTPYVEGRLLVIGRSRGRLICVPLVAS